MGYLYATFYKARKTTDGNLKIIKFCVWLLNKRLLKDTERKCSGLLNKKALFH